MIPGKLKLAGAAIVAAFLLAFGLNGANNFWLPQFAMKARLLFAPVETAMLQTPEPERPLASELSEQPEAVAAEAPWNRPVSEPKLDRFRVAQRGGLPALKAPDFHQVLKAPIPQTLPPAAAEPDAEVAVVSIKPIFNSKSGAMESGVIGAATNFTGSTGNAVNGAASGAGALLKR